MKSINVLHRMYKLSGQKRQYFLQVLMIILLGIVNAINSVELGAIAQGIADMSTSTMLNSFVILVITSFAAAIITWLRSNHLVAMTERIKAAYRIQTTAALMRAEYSSVQGKQTGELISRVTSDTNSAGYGNELLIGAVRSIVIPLLLLIVIIALDWRLGLGFLIPLALIYIHQKIVDKANGGVMPWRMAHAAMAAETQGLISNRTTIKAYRLQSKADEWMMEKTEDYRRKGNRGIGMIYAASVPGLFVNCLPMLGCMAVGAYLVYYGSLTVQGFVSVFMLAQVATYELVNLPNVFINLPTCLASARRMFELLDIAPEPSGSTKAATGKTVVEFNDVSFGYNDTTVLNGLTFSVAEGEKVALVGPSGCGKSTVLKLITGLYRPKSGQVRLWDNDLCDWDLEALRSRISFMQQEPFIYDSTVKLNIACADSSASQEQIALAAQKANLLEWINQQPLGWDAPTGERGNLLSGGLRQRVSLARIFIQDTPLLLFDEATAALDSQNEADVLSVIKTISENKTQITVAHRLSAIVDADRIIVIKDGVVAEEGKHEDLLASNGVYAALYHEQESEQAETGGGVDE